MTTNKSAKKTTAKAAKTATSKTTKKAAAKKAASKVKAINTGLPKGEPTGPLCKCGCGEKTWGGVFRQGHDMKLRHALAEKGKAYKPLAA